MTIEYTKKLHAGTVFPDITVRLVNGGETNLGAPEKGFDWKMVVVYRGQHCPLCTKYLNQLQSVREELARIGVDLIAVSGDSKSQLESHLERLEIDYPIAFGLSTNEMESLGVYISDPRSAQETDHPFAEPGLFVINSEGAIQVVDISNNPFVRPEIQALVNGLAWIRDPSNNYPIRGMHK